jgi:hypothetical protein
VSSLDIVCGGDPAGKAVMCHLRDLAYLGLAEWYICGHRSDRRIAARRCYDAVAIHNRRHHVAEPLPVLPSGAGEVLVGVGMVDTVHGIHGREGACYDVNAQSLVAGCYDGSNSLPDPWITSEPAPHLDLLPGINLIRSGSTDGTFYTCKKLHVWAWEDHIVWG